MKILNEKITLNSLPSLENTKYFPDMVKAVVDVERDLIALNAEMHVDLEQFLLDDGSIQKNLYGINIYFDGDVEFDSAINPPRNREAGFPRVGRYVADPKARALILEVVNKWIEM
jgi:hypothetical protein